jgi:ATP-dependent DNA helicase DinG
LLGVRAHDELEAFLGDLGNGLGEQYQRFCDNGGGRVRVAQRTMVARLTGAVLGGEHMVAQAPTGTGKSYAYLLAAALSGRRTLVSTSSKELQRQLTEPGRDIAVVGEFSSWLGAWQTAMLQGRSNYLCARRVAEAEGEGAELGALKDWDEVHRGVPLVEAGKLGKTKWSLSISSEECAGRECSHFNECSYEEAKARAIAADVVVVNHDLLAYLAMGEHPVLASRELVVIDEAHDLVERTRAALARALSGAGLRRLATQAANLGITDGVVQLRAVADELEQALAGVRSDLRCDWRLFGGALGSVLAKLESVLGELVRTPRPGGCELADWERWMEQVKSRVPLVEAVSSPDEDHYTYIEGQGQGISLQLGVVEVSRFLSGLLFGRVPCVLTSATLSVDGSFDWLIERSGVGLGTRAVRQLMLGSPFALDEHVDLYIPGPGSPSPRDEGEGWREWSTTTTLELVKASRGGALVLTTSTARVAELAGALRGIFGERVMSQQTGAGTAGLSSWLGEQSDRILVATRSLWQGVDIPGPALRLLIIDRIPFEPRDSPLARALERRVGSRAAFLEYSLPAAALVLAQGAGRLIRREDDRGVVAVLDCRVWQWGELRAALPVVPDMALHSDLKRILMRLESRAELVVEAGVQQP